MGAHQREVESNELGVMIRQSYVDSWNVGDDTIRLRTESPEQSE